MRELVYVSAAKLRQLVLDLPKGSRRLPDVEAEVTTPLARFKVGKTARTSEPSLAAAVAVLEASSRAPLWFADPAVRPGSWVHFEAPLSLCAVCDAAIFIDVEQASPEYPSGGILRLFLHGSRHHIIGAPKIGDDTYALSPSFWHRFFDVLKEYEKDVEVNCGMDGRGVPTISSSRVGMISRRVGEFTSILQPRYTAAWMSGYARVTAVFPGEEFPEVVNSAVLAATPLYVEHINPPGNSIEPTK